MLGEDFSYSSIDSLQNFQSDIVKEKIKKQVLEKLNKTVELMKEDSIDILDLYTKFNAFKHSDWSKYLKGLENPTEYLKNIEININLHLLNI